MSKVTEKVIRKKKAIIEKTSNLLKKTKFENLTVQMICEEAEISIGTFYHYFETKDDLIVGMFELYDEYLEREILGTLTSGDEAVNVIRFCRGYAEYMSHCGVKYAQILNSLYPCGKDYSRVLEKKRPLFTELKKIIVRGMEKGQFGSVYNADMLTEMLVGVLRGYCFDWSRRGGGYDLVGKTVTYAEIFVRVLQVSAAAKTASLLSYETDV